MAIGCWLLAVSQELFGTLQVLWGVDADGLNVGLSHTDAIAILQPAQLLQTLRYLQRTLGQLSYFTQYLATVGIDAEMLQEGELPEPLLTVDGAVNAPTVAVFLRMRFIPRGISSRPRRTRAC